MFYITFYVKLFPWFTFWFQNGRRWPSWNSNMTCFIILFNFFTLIIFLCEIIIIQQKNDKRSIALKIITYIKEIKYGRWQPSWILKVNQNLIQKNEFKVLDTPPKHMLRLLLQHRVLKEHSYNNFQNGCWRPSWISNIPFLIG